jgi:hypothetical protein
METQDNILLEDHKFIDIYPIKSTSKHLIIGTIHAPYNNNFLLDYFYGSSLSLWRLFHDAFPEIDLNPQSLDSVLSFLDRNEISMTDTIKTCHRKKPGSALDKDLIPTVFNESMIDSIINSDIMHLYFTSGFDQHGAFKFFYTGVLKNPYMKDWMKANKEFNLEIDNKKTVTCHILISPSDTATRSIGRIEEYKANKEFYMNTHYPPSYAYKIARYREIFTFLK